MTPPHVSSDSSAHATPLRCAAVGVGRMGRHHARLFATTPGAELVAVVDGNAQRAADIVEQYGGRAFATVEELLAADLSIDAASIATPTIHHRAAAEKLIASGIACLIEKPLAPDVAEARALADAAAQHNIALQVGHVVRYDPVMQAIQQLGELHPRFIEVDRISPMTFRSVDVGVVLDMMIHDLDVLLMLTGSEPIDVQASAVSVLGEAEDVCNARLTFPPGSDGISCVANLTASRLALKTERKIRIIGNDTYVSADFAARKGTVVRKTANDSKLQEIRAALRNGEDLSHMNYLDLVQRHELDIADAEPLKLQMQDFLGAVREKRRPTIDAEAGLAAVRTAERIVAAARQAGSRMY